MQDMRKAAGELLVELEKKGITFETVDGKLKYKDSNSYCWCRIIPRSIRMVTIFRIKEERWKTINRDCYWREI